MKKVKLFTSLSSLGVLAIATPIVATSCSKNQNTLDISLQSAAIITVEDVKTFTLEIKCNGNQVGIKELNVTSKNTDLLTINNDSIDKEACTFEATGVKEGKAKIEVEVTDEHDDKNTTTIEIDVRDADEKLVITTGTLPTQIKKGEDGEFTVTIKYDGADATISECEVESSNPDVLTGTYRAGKVTLTGKSAGKASITLYVTDTNEHYNEIEIEGEIPVVAPSTIKYNNIEYIISSDDAPHDPIYDLDPNMFCTFDENDDFKEISFYGKVAPGSSGNSGTIDINSATGLNYIQEISIGSCKSDITSINDSFLSGCTNLTSVDLSGFTGSVTSIGDDFLSWSTKLTSIDLSPLKDVTTIGESFIEQSALASINLSPLSNVTTIGNWFLCDCKSLTSVDCSVLTAMATTSTATIGSAFLYGCEKLTNINMGAISASKLDTGAASEGGNDYYSFAVDDTSCLAYTNGITLTGTDKTAIITAFPNRSYTAKEITDNFRKWVD